ncbi:MAG: hypothetical protein KME09_00405 [Pleurocapsa minor HA4230-MV1]|jgi:hypothetical protein|nr:hypothetical protein [Pleurocapsa minor HA4230-MV1]
MQRLISLDANTLKSFGDRPETILTENLALQIAIATHPDTPPHVLEVLANSDQPEVAEAARLHVNYAGELAGNWQDVVDELFKNRYLGQNDRLAVELLKIAPVPAYFFSEYVPPEYLIQGLNNPYLPLRYRLQLLTRLAQEPTLEPRLEVAESPDAPLPVLKQLIGDLELPIRIAVQYNPHCPPELVQLVTGQHEVASNWDTDTQQLDNLSNSNWDWIRLAVAQNPSASEATLLKLAGDRAFKIQLAVAKNPVTPANILVVLAQHSSQEIQAEVAKHLKATEEILHSLFDTQQGVIKSRQDLPASILERVFNNRNTNFSVWKDTNIRDFLLKQSNTPNWILAEFADVDLDEMRTAKLAKRSRQPKPEVLEKWIQDDLKFLIDIAKHPQVSVEIIEQIIPYPNFGIKLAAAQNQKTPEAIRIQLLNNLIQSECKERILMQILMEIAGDSNTPIPILEELAGELFSIGKVINTLSNIVPITSQSLLDKIVNFIDKHQSPDQILFWLRQDSVFCNPILQDWNQIVNSLDEAEILQLNVMSMMMMPAIGLNGGVPSHDKRWLDRGLNNSSVNPADLLENLPPTYSLYGLLILAGMSHQSDRRTQGIIIGLLRNPSTPNDIRNNLWERYQEQSDDLNCYRHDAFLRFSLGCNPAVEENKRYEYLEQALSSGYSNVIEAIVLHCGTPVEILEKIANRRVGGLQQVVKNPNCPVHLLRQTVEEIENNSGLSHTLVDVAKNPNTPIDLLEKLALNKGNYGVREAVLKNPNIDYLTLYKIKLQIQEKEENDKANQILAKRTDSPYALARVLETGDRNVKISAARNPKTPIQVLEQLAKDQDETVRSVMAQNQNLPLNILLELAEDSSVRIRLNLAHKNNYSKIKTPVQLLEKLAKDELEKVRAKVAEHSDTPEELLVQLANDSSIEVKRKLATNLNTPATVLNRLGLKDNIVNKRNPNTPPMVLAQAVKRINSKALAEFIKHPVKGTQMPGETLAELANHQDASVRYRVAVHPNTPTRILEQLARDSYIATIRAVASNPNTPPSALEYLADNPDLTTRLSIVRHPNTPAKVLRQIVENAQRSANAPNTTKDSLKSGLFGDAYDLLIAIASNPKTPIDALEIIARREFVSPTRDPKSILPPRTDNDVIKSLVYNPSLTPELLNILTQDPCLDVRVALTRHPNLIEELWIKLTEDQNISVRKAVASKINAPINILETIAQDNVTDVRLEVAGNNKTPSQVLEQLSQDTEAKVRTKVAANPNTSINILEILAEDESVEVRRAVANNFNTPKVIKNSLKDLLPTTKSNNQTISPTLRGLSRIYNHATDDLPSLLSEYVEPEVPFVRFISLLHPLTPIEILENGANSVSWIERYAVANNPATPTEIKQQLIQDSNQIVRAVALNNLLL